MSKLYIAEKYGQTPNELLNNKDVSLKAKGLYGYMQSKPDGWRFSVKLISTQLLEGQLAVKTGLQELEAVGYLKRNNYQLSSGKWTTDYYLYAKPTCGQPTPDEPTPVRTDTVKPPIISNKELSKKDIVRKKDNTETSSEVFIFQEELTKLKSSTRFIDRFALLVITRKGLSFENKKQYINYLKQCWKWGKDAEGYSGDQINNAINYLEGAGLSWSPKGLVANLAEANNK